MTHPNRIRVYLVGGSTQVRAQICHAAQGVALHIEPVAAIDELTGNDLEKADVLLAWDDGSIVPRLRNHLSELGGYCPMIALGDAPEPSRIVQAILAGARDYLKWPCEVDQLHAGVTAACEENLRLRPRLQRQAEARRVLQTLTPREREVLAAVAQGMNSRAIGAQLEISPRTVEIHRANMMHKIGARNAADAVRLLIEAAANSELGFNNDNWVAPWTDGDEPAQRAIA